MQRSNEALLLVFTAALAACSNDNEDSSVTQACDAEAEVMTTASGVEYVRTPDACFNGLPDWPYEYQFVEIDGLRQAYVEEGPADGEVILLLHGQPSWSYLYRKMIPGLSEAGFRVIAMDHLGMGRSDKPIDIEDYSYLGHNDRLEAFIQELALEEITVFMQDWGLTIGMRVVGLHPEWFARVIAANGDMPQFPAGTEVFPPVENPNEVEDLPSPFEGAPPQQEVGYDGCEPLFETDPGGFGVWIEYALKGASFVPSEVLEAITWFDVPSDEEAAYNAPFPSRIYMAGPRIFPALINDMDGETQAAWDGLASFDKPFLTLWGANDTGNLGLCETQDNFICTAPGAEGQPHARIPEAGHYVQSDQGEELVRRIVAWMNGDTSVSGNHVASCELEDSASATGPGGLGSACQTDADCAGQEASSCFSAGPDGGFCTIEGCGAGTCGGPFVCCRECDPAAASALPFEESACVADTLAPQLSSGAGCTCD
ncbi:MAG: haloalkane dehalogenase [Myxococcota bacterium]